MPIAFEILFMCILCISCPLIDILPILGSYNLNSRLVNVDFPEPDYPTNAIFSFFLTVRLKFLKIGIGLIGYSKVIFSIFKFAPSSSVASSSLSSEIKEGIYV